MTHSLTILVPVRNAQATLASSVQEALEVFSELSDRLELLIVDDASDDATGEVAEELRRNYPQVRSVYHGERLGREAAIRSGLNHARGDIVLLRDDEDGMAPAEVVRWWRSAEEAPADGGAVVARRIDPGADRLAAPPRRSARYRVLRRAGGRVAPSHGAGPNRPNYLARLKAFALGE